MPSESSASTPASASVPMPIPLRRRNSRRVAGSEETLYNRRTLNAYGLEKGSAEAAVRALVDRGDVQRTEFGFMIVDPLLERWLRRTQR
jgi:hypothetical protein